ncbi:MAG: hypothetical protein ACWGQW_08125 [bacterium]
MGEQKTIDDNRLILAITRPTVNLYQLTLHYDGPTHDSVILLVSESEEVIAQKARDVERVAHGHITVNH